MSEILLRAGVILGVVALSALIAWLIRRRTAEIRRFQQDVLEAGVYLFTSETCSSCAPVRERLRSMVGQSGFEELAWEDDDETFQILAVDKVPAILTVAANGRSALTWGAAAQSWAP